MERTTCCVVGGGPAGMVLGLILARAGVDVTVLEKHGDFLRDFRGDTVHSSTLTLLDELGLGPAFARVPHRLVESVSVELDSGMFKLADLSRLPGAHKHIALVPQWDLLDLLAAAGAKEPTYRLLMNAEVTQLTKDGRTVTGVTYRRNGASHTLAADLVIACDGRDSVIRRSLGAAPRNFGVPMDVWWFRLPRRSDDRQGATARFSTHSGMVLLDRGDYFQAAYLIAKGTDRQLRAEGIESFRQRVRTLLPWLGDRVESVGSLDEVKLLNVSLNRLRRWYADGVLLVGDAAHAMSPVGGVGINLAIQDAVAAARLLGPALRSGAVGTSDLRRVQLRRWLPTWATQTAQRVAHRAVLGRRIGSGLVDTTPDPDASTPLPIRALQRFPLLQTLPAMAVAIGLLPEHAPTWARRTPEAVEADHATAVG